MEARIPMICRVQQVAVGALFVLVGGSKGAPICLRAAFSAPDEEERIVPLYWPESQESVGVAIYASALNGYAVVLTDARLEVNALSPDFLEVMSPTAVYARDGRLFFPISNDGNVRALVDVSSGEIVQLAGGSYVAFEDWRITVDNDALERTVILPIADEDDPTS